MERRSVSPETLAAQALGDVNPVSGGLAPVINPSANYEQQADGSYLEDRQYTRADNPTFEHAERLLAALEGAGCACALFASGMAAATAVFQSLLPGDHVLVSRVLYWGCASGWPSSASPGAWTWSSPTPPTWRRCRPRSGRAAPVGRDTGQPAGPPRRTAADLKPSSRTVVTGLLTRRAPTGLVRYSL